MICERLGILEAGAIHTLAQKAQRLLAKPPGRVVKRLEPQLQPQLRIVPKLRA